jgi:NodT family efflux transporter outer membrane factor (OMF) lipoprotein
MKGGVILVRSGLILSGLALSACATTVERAPQPASVVLPDAFAMLNSEPPARGDIAALLPTGDGAFAALSTRALADAPTLDAALARIDAARASLRGAGAARLPNITGSAGASQSEGNAAQAGGSAPPGADFSRTRLDAGINASWEVDLFGRLRASERAASARLDAASADADGVRLALLSDIAEAIIDERTLSERASVIRADLTSAQELVAITQIRVRAGISPGFDLVRAQSLEADAQARLSPIAAERATIIGRLVTLTALPTAEVMAALAQPAGPVLDARPIPAAPSLVLRARPDVRAAEARLSATDADIAAAAAERYPRFTLSGALGLVALGFGGLFDEDALTGSLGGAIAGPLLDFGRIAARIEGSQANAREAFATYRGTLYRALGESEAAFGAIRAGDERVRLLTTQASLDADGIGLARERYRRGLDTFLTVIDAERSANASRTALAVARGTAQRARVALYRALGGANR